MKENTPNFENKYQRAFGYNRILRWLFGYPIFGIFVHWALQGILNMDRTELWFKLLLDLGLTLSFTLLLNTWFSLLPAFLVGFFIAHSLNFLFNAQAWVVLRIYGYFCQSYASFDNFQQQFISRVLAEPSIGFAAIYGSLVRGDAWRPSTDLDVRLVRHKGVLNGLRACRFVLAERTRALWRCFPLDVYVLDSPASLSRMRSDEKPIVIKQRSPGNLNV